MEPRPAILVLTREALKTAERIKTLWPDTELHGPHDIVFDFDEIFTDAKGHLQDLFAANTTHHSTFFDRDRHSLLGPSPEGQAQ